MKQRYNYPFAAIVGQEQIKKALFIVLTNPKAGGLLIGSGNGAAKTTIIRSCEAISSGKKIINLPLNVTEDMLWGSIDIETALKKGAKHWIKGLLDRANENILYVDDANLLRWELLDAICNIHSNKINQVERDGISYKSDVEFTLIAAMNFNEAELSSHMIDKFGLYVQAVEEKDIVCRVEIIKRVLEYEKAPQKFCQYYLKETERINVKIAKARQLLSQVEISGAMLLLAAQLCTKALCEGHQAELYLIETAKALAALAERNYVLPQDINEAAVFVLTHRIRSCQQSPASHDSDDNGTDNDDIDNEQTENDGNAADENQTDTNSNNTDENYSQNNNDRMEDSKEEPQSQPSAGEEKNSDIDKNIIIPQLQLEKKTDRKYRHGIGKRSTTKTSLKQGRYVRAEIPRGVINDIALDATIRMAVPFQKIREKTECALTILTEDIRQKVREKRVGATFLFVVDASGSMGAYERMKAVKGAVFYMLQQAYQKRDSVGMISFRRNSAEVLLPITRSVDLAQKCLQQMPTGGKTPLNAGLTEALHMLTKENKKNTDLDLTLILITDGRANNISGETINPVESAIKTAQKIKKNKINSVVIDTERDFIKLGIARDIAVAMGGTYYELNNLKTESIIRIIDNMGE